MSNQITTRHEFETIPAFTIPAFITLAGSAIGEVPPREVAFDLIKVADLVSAHIDAKSFWIQLAKLYDADVEEIEQLQEDVVEQLNYYANVPFGCTIRLQENEWQVLPEIDEDVPRFDEVPDKYTEDHIYVVSDHGNVTCYEWDWQANEYREIWAVV